MIAKKSLGQHWLHDEGVLQAIADAADVTSSDVVLEIGPGHGTLTQELTKRASQVIAIELDPHLISKLCARFHLSHNKVNNTYESNIQHDVQGSTSHNSHNSTGQTRNKHNLKIIQGDILKFDLTSLPPGYKVVANIPYYLTSNLLRVLSESPNPPMQMALLIQKEVAERITANPGGMSLLSVSVQFYYKASLGQVVSAKLFTPPPKVDSQILKLARHPKPLFLDIDTKQYFRLVKAGFSNRRKTLLNSLSAGLGISREDTKSVLTMSKLDPKSRPQELSLADWHKLYQAVK